MIHYAVSAFSPEPRWSDYHTTALIDQNSAEYQKQDTAYRAVEKAFEQHLFFVAVPLGLITIIVGAFLPIPAIGTHVRRHLQCMRRLLQLLVGVVIALEVPFSARRLYRSAC